MNNVVRICEPDGNINTDSNYTQMILAKILMS